MKVAGIKCLDCGYTIWSKHRHDMVWCDCGSVAIDGGRDYTKISFSKDSKGYLMLELEIDSVGGIKSVKERE